MTDLPCTHHLRGYGPRERGSTVVNTVEDAVPPIGTQLGRLAELDPGATAVTCEGTTITRGVLDASTNQLARAYQERGVGQGDYVTIVLPNCIEMLQAAIATWKLGAVVQPLSPRSPDHELAELLLLTPRALLVGRQDPNGVVPSLPPEFVASAELPDDPLPEVVSPVWKAMASGGSTGRPKLIETTEDSRVDAAAYGAAFGLREGATQLVPGPLAHNAPFALTVFGLLLGHHIVLMSKFDARECLRLMTEHRVEWMMTVPTVLRRMLPVFHAEPSRYDLSSLQRLWHLAEPCSPTLKDAWIEILGPETVWELYGGTELQAMTFIDGHQWQAHRGSVGQVAVGRMRVLDEEGRDCPPGVVGEIYMRPADGSAPTYRYIGSDPVSRDGWDTIGDMGWFDEDGYLYLGDRRVDMFNVGGRKVYPAEVELALTGHPDVLSCLVVGVPDEDLGQVPYALVETAASADLDAATVRGFLAERVANYKVPRFVEFRAEPLRDSAGKAQRSAVRDQVMRSIGEDAPSTS